MGKKTNQYLLSSVIFSLLEEEEEEEEEKKQIANCMVLYLYKIHSIIRLLLDRLVVLF